MLKRYRVVRFQLAVLSVIGVLLGALHCSAALVAHYTFDNADTIVSGNGGDPNLGGTPRNIMIKDISGNGNDAHCTATQLSQNGSGVFGCAISTGEPGVIGESHKFFRDPSDFNLASANSTYTVPPGVVPIGADPRSFSLWFRQEADITAGGSQDKLFGYGTPTAGQAFDVSLEGGGIRIRHFGGNITYGSGFEFYETDSNGNPLIGKDAGWHHLLVRVNSGASTFADVDVLLDGVLLAVSAQAGNGTSQTLNTVEGNNPLTGWPSHGFGIGTTTIRNGGASQNGFQGWLDDFRIYDTAIPEPTSAVLMLLALSGTCFRERRHMR